MHGQSGILSRESVLEYFRGLVAEAKRSQRVEVADLTEFYVVNLLAGFLDSEKLWVRDDDGVLRQEPLAFILQRALEEQGARRVQALRRLGDVSLYLSGFFADSLAGRVVDVDYYIRMGHLAYSTLGRTLTEGRDRDLTFARVFAELADKFTPLVDVLNEVSERLALTSQQGVLRLYERFRRTGSARLARLLASQGVAPVLAGPGGVQ